VSAPEASVADLAAPRLPPLARFSTVFAWGVRRAVRSRRFALTAGIATLAGLGLGWVARQHPDEVFAAWHLLGESLLGVAVPLVALALVGSGFGEEVQDRTLVFHLVRPVSRTTVFLARFLAGLLCGVVASAAMLLAAASFLDLPGGALLRLAAIGALGTATVGSVYYALAALFRRGLVAGLVYTFVVEGFVQFLPGSIQKLSLMHHVRSVFHRSLDEEFAARSSEVSAALAPPPPATLDPSDLVQAGAREEWTTVPSALLVCGVVIAGALLLAARSVARRDFALKD
jgi:ABC-type transport system involved in multi-copper enzyme maturation permease subunit